VILYNYLKAGKSLWFTGFHFFERMGLFSLRFVLFNKVRGFNSPANDGSAFVEACGTHSFDNECVRVKSSSVLWTETAPINFSPLQNVNFATGILPLSRVGFLNLGNS
jgi:hypothetical protein